MTSAARLNERTARAIIDGLSLMSGDLRAKFMRADPRLIGFDVIAPPKTKTKTKTKGARAPSEAQQSAPLVGRLEMLRRFRLRSAAQLSRQQRRVKRLSSCMVLFR